MKAHITVVHIRIHHHFSAVSMIYHLLLSLYDIFDSFIRKMLNKMYVMHNSLFTFKATFSHVNKGFPVQYLEVDHILCNNDGRKL